MSIKCLITGGCSFTQVISYDTNWPIPLKKALNPEQVFHTGQGGAGNGIISRKIIYALTEALKTYAPEDILVGIMWSGCNRRDLYSSQQLNCQLFGPYYHEGKEVETYRNPLKIVDQRNYYIANLHWSDEVSSNFRKATTDEDSVLVTLEHILRTQWFLKLHNIKYFMTEYDQDVFVPTLGDDKLKIVNSNKDFKFLYSQIDFSNWLPIESMYYYSRYESGYDFPRENDPHPGTEQSKEMVEKVLLPFLKNKYNIE